MLRPKGEARLAGPRWAQARLVGARLDASELWDGTEEEVDCIPPCPSSPFNTPCLPHCPQEILHPRLNNPSLPPTRQAPGLPPSLELPDPHICDSQIDSVLDLCWF